MRVCVGLVLLRKFFPVSVRPAVRFQGISSTGQRECRRLCYFVLTLFSPIAIVRRTESNAQRSPTKIHSPTNPHVHVESSVRHARQSVFEHSRVTFLDGVRETIGHASYADRLTTVPVCHGLAAMSFFPQTRKASEKFADMVQHCAESGILRMGIERRAPTSIVNNPVEGDEKTSTRTSTTTGSFSSDLANIQGSIQGISSSNSRLWVRLSSHQLHRRPLQLEPPAAGLLSRHEYLPLPLRSNPRPMMPARPRRSVRREDSHGHLRTDFLHFLQQPGWGNTLVSSGSSARVHVVVTGLSRRLVGG